MKVLFIQNNGIQESIGVANLSAILKANGHEADLLLVSHTPDLIGAIREYDPGLIAFSALTGVHHSLELLALMIKEQLDIPIIVGGPHPTYSPDMIMSPGIDIICRGEGELAMLELADPGTAKRLGALAHRYSRLLTWPMVAERLVRAMAIPGVDSSGLAEFL